MLRITMAATPPLLPPLLPLLAIWARWNALLGFARMILIFPCPDIMLQVVTTKHKESVEELNKELSKMKAELKQEQEAHTSTASKLGNTKDTVAARNISITQMKLRIRKMEGNVKDLTTQLRNATSIRNYLQVRGQRDKSWLSKRGE